MSNTFSTPLPSPPLPSPPLPSPPLPLLYLRKPRPGSVCPGAFPICAKAFPICSRAFLVCPTPRQATFFLYCLPVLVSSLGTTPVYKTAVVPLHSTALPPPLPLPATPLRSTPLHPPLRSALSHCTPLQCTDICSTPLTPVDSAVSLRSYFEYNARGRWVQSTATYDNDVLWCRHNDVRRRKQYGRQLCVV